MRKWEEMSNEQKRRMSETRKRRGVAKGKNNSFYGKRHTNESKRKMSESQKKNKNHPTRFKKGHIPWTTGKQRSIEFKIKNSLAHRGKNVSDETKRKLSLINRGNTWKKRFGAKKAQELREYFSRKYTGEGHPQYGKSRSEETKKKLSEAMKKHSNKQSQIMRNGRAAYMISFIKNPSKPQLRLFDFIKEIYPTTQLNYPIKIWNEKHYSLDVAVPGLKIDFEYDEPYWHKIKNREVSDLFRDERLIEKGWCVVRIDGQKELEKIIGFDGGGN